MNRSVVEPGTTVRLSVFDPGETARRLIIIGDIHGCFDELVELLARLHLREDDVVVSTGDLVRKGPHSVKCVEFWRERGYLAVIGNNEEKILKRARSWWRRYFDPDRAILRRSDLLEYFRSLPALIDFPNEGVAVVHGGVLPDMNLTTEEVERERASLLRLRRVRKTRRGWSAVPKEEESRDDPFWADVWKGPRTIVYGHSPTQDHLPRIHPFAIGLDTGCVYGGRLTAAIFDGSSRFESVAAHRTYSRR